MLISNDVYILLSYRRMQLMESVKNNIHPQDWSNQELCDYVIAEGIFTVDQLMALAPTKDQLVRIVLLDEIDKE